MIKTLRDVHAPSILLFAWLIPSLLWAEAVECGLVLFGHQEIAQVSEDSPTEKRVCERVIQRSADGEIHGISPIDDQVTLGIVPISMGPNNTPSLSSLKLEVRYHYSGEEASERGDDEPDQTYTFPNPSRPRDPNPDPSDNNDGSSSPGTTIQGMPPHTAIGARISILPPEHHEGSAVVAVSVRCAPSSNEYQQLGDVESNVLDLGPLSSEDICR